MIKSYSMGYFLCFSMRKIFLVLENGGAVRRGTLEKARFITTGFGYIDISCAVLCSLFPSKQNG
jgi:hypothetical protein